MHLKVLGSPNPAIHNIMRPKKLPVFSAANTVPLQSAIFLNPLSKTCMFQWLQCWRRKSRTRQAILYTRAGCHLCDVAAETLRAAGYTIQIIDIDGDPALRSQFDHEVPVVEIAGRIRFRGHVDPLLLRRLP